MSVWIKHVTHLKKLEIPFYLLGGDGFGHIEPGGPGGALVVLNMVVSFAANSLVLVKKMQFDVQSE